MLRVAIRADACAAWGTGHLRRCLALARALKDCGAECVFVTRAIDDVASAVLRTQPFACHWLGGSASAQADDAAQSARAFAQLAPDWVVVDHYGLGALWHRAVCSQSATRIAAIDDLADRAMAPELLLDANLHADTAAKYDGVLQGHPKLLAGPRYALLDEVYASSPKHVVGDAVNSIGIFMGGTDPTGACLAAVRACRDMVGFEGVIEVVSSPLSPRHQELLELCARWPVTTVLDGLANLSDFFRRHDLQIGAGGGSTWERCCIGTPTLACDVAPNQLASLPALADAGALVWVRGGGDLARTLGQALIPLLRDAALRRRLSERSRGLVDGLGAPRVAAVLACAAGAPLAARPAQLGDEGLLLDWANDPRVREQGFHPEPIGFASHSAWFRARLADAGRCRMAIVEAPNGIPVGQVRLERADEGWEIGYSIDPAFRGLGLGQRLLAAGVPSALAPGRLLGRVKPSNEASARVFHALGFRATRVTDWRGDHWLFSTDAPLAQVPDNTRHENF